MSTACVEWGAEGTSHSPPSTPARPGCSDPPPPPPASPTLVITQDCVISLGLEGLCASAQGHSGMGRDANKVSMWFYKTTEIFGGHLGN